MRMRSLLPLILVGCTQSQAPANPDAGSAEAGAVAAPALTCLGILQCAAKCSTNACGDDCVSKGSADAKSQVTDLVTCYQNHMCMDSMCLQTNCNTQLETCVKSSNSSGGGMTITGSVPQGMVPASLVGTWAFISGYSSSDEESWTFNADGTATYAHTRDGSYGGCTNLNIENRSGTVVADATSITFYVSSDTVTEMVCAVKSSPKPQQNKVYAYAYSFDDSGKLKIVDNDCAAQYAGYDTSIGLYCTGTFTKQ